jgi:hypothetical protein
MTEVRHDPSQRSLSRGMVANHDPQHILLRSNCLLDLSHSVEVSVIAKLLSFLFPYRLPSRLGTMLAAQGSISDHAKSVFHD